MVASFFESALRCHVTFNSGYVSESVSLQYAASQMCKKPARRCLGVIDFNSRLVGYLSQRDVMRSCEMPYNDPVSRAMHVNPEVIQWNGNETIAWAVRNFVIHDRRHLLGVSDDGRYSWISLSSVVSAFLDWMIRNGDVLNPDNPILQLMKSNVGTAVSPNDAVSVSGDATLLDAARLMNFGKKGTAGIVEPVLVSGERKRLNPLGIVTERDVLQAVADNKTLSEVPLSIFCGRYLVSVPHFNSHYAAALTMYKMGIRHVVVTDDDGSLYGVYGMRLFIRELADCFPSEFLNQDPTLTHEGFNVERGSCGSSL
ncbi:MAG TPA: CBS domain-containing protein [Oligoflexia bacterium]|nr:CBS domain-containing protein [Oligoflexia bacterium]